MRERIALLKALIDDMRNDGLLSISTSSGDSEIRIHFSSFKHPDSIYREEPHSEVYNQMVTYIGGATVFYLVDKDA